MITVPASTFCPSVTSTLETIPEVSETTLAGVGTTTSSTTHYPVFISGLGSEAPYISTTSNYPHFLHSSLNIVQSRRNAGQLSF